MLQLSRILVAIDFCPASLAALRMGRELAEKFGATLELLHVADPDSVRGTDDVSVLFRGVPESTLEVDSEKLVKERLSAFVREAGLERVVRNDEIEEGDDPGQTIIEHATARNIDLLVMGTRSKKGVSTLFVGSVAQKVLKNAPCPILSCPPLG